MTKKRFESTIVRTRTKAYVPVPFDPNEAWGWRVRHYVKGSVGGCSIRGLLRSEEGGYALPLGAAWLRDNVIPSPAWLCSVTARKSSGVGAVKRAKSQASFGV